MPVKALILSALSLMLHGCIGAAYLSDASSKIEDNSLKNRADVLFSKGDPYLETKNSLIYKSKQKRMRGVAIALIIPIPLYLPIGKEEITYHLEGEEVIEVTRLHLKSNGSFCGIVPDTNTHIEFKFGCTSFNNEGM